MDLNNYNLLKKQVQDTDLNYEQILSMAKQKILKSAQSDNKDYKKLEQYLEDVLYGTSDKGRGLNEFKKLQEAMSQYLQDKIGVVINNYDFSTNIIKDESDVQQKAIDLQNTIKERISLQHKKYIEVETVKQRKEQAEKALTSMTNIKDVKDQQDKLKELIAVCENLLKQDLPSDGRIKVTDDTFSLIKRADDLYSQVIFFRSMILSNQDIGAIFEKVLTLLSEQGSSLVNMTIDEMLAKLNSSTQGSKIVSRGGFLEIEQNFLEEKRKKEKKKNEKQSFSYSLQEPGPNGSSFEFTDEFTDKQGKVDVIFTLPELKQEFRISAKNWSSMVSHDFGTTSIESALMRTAGLFPTLKYGSVLGVKNRTKINTTNAHNFAKVAIFVDIVMGFSQKQGYTDTIVINNRGGGYRNHIKVYSIYSLIDKMTNNIPTPTGYKEATIENALQVQGAKQYYAHILSILKSFKVSISIEQLNSI